MTAPAPVWMPQASGPSSSSGAVCGTLTTFTHGRWRGWRRRTGRRKIAVDALVAGRKRARTIGACGKEVAREEFVAIADVMVLTARAVAAGIEGHHHLSPAFTLDTERPTFSTTPAPS